MSVLKNLDSSSLGDTKATWGYSVSDSFNPVSEKFVVFCTPQLQDSFPNPPDAPKYYVTDGITNVENIAINCPSNAYWDFGKGRYGSISFGSEISISATGSTSENIDYSLFKAFHENYIVNIYNPQTRVVSLSVNIPLSLMTKLKMNDTVTLKSKKVLNKLNKN